MQGKALYLQEDVEAVWSEATKIKDNLFREAASNVSSCSTWQQNVQTDPPVRRESVLAGKPVDHFFLRRSGGVSERGPQRARGWRVGVEKREPSAEILSVAKDLFLSYFCCCAPAAYRSSPTLCGSPAQRVLFSCNASPSSRTTELTRTWESKTKENIA